MENVKNISFIDSAAIVRRPEIYMGLTVDTILVLASWRDSLFSFEWLMPDGTIRHAEELPEHERVKREQVEQKIEKSEALEKPVLGIGLQDNIEIGSGRAEFLTLAARGFREIPVHILKSHEKDFKAFAAPVKS